MAGDEETLTVRFSAVEDGLAAVAATEAKAIDSVAAASMRAAAAFDAHAAATKAMATGTKTATVATEEFAVAQQFSAKWSRGHEDALTRLANTVRGKLSTTFRGFVSGAGEFFLRWMKRGALAIGLMGVAATGLGLKLAMANEQWMIGAQRMLGSHAAAVRLRGELERFATRTPFQLSDLKPLSMQLLGQGFKASQIVPTLSGLGDVVSGTGGGKEELARVVANLGQIEAAKKISGRELRDFAMNRIPALSQIAKALHMTEAQIQAMTATAGGGADLYKRVGGGAGLATILGGGKFRGGMEAQSRSLAGILSNARDSFEIGMSHAMERVLPRLSKSAGGMVQRIGPVMTNVGNRLGELFTAGLDFLSKNGGTIRAVLGVVRDFGLALANDIVPFLKGAAPILVIVGAALLGVVKGATWLLKALKPVLPVLVPLIAAWFALNATFLATPIGAVVGLVAALVVGIVTLYQRSTTFRHVVQAVGRAGKAAFGWIADAIRGVMHFMDRLIHKAGGAKKALLWMNPITAPIMAGRAIANGLGDTTRPRALAGTMAMASVLAPAGGGFAVTSGVRDYALGYPSSGHTKGTALDVTGTHLGGLADRWNAAGGFAEMHGTGTGRHLHMERPVGDVASPRSFGRTGGGDVITIGPIYIGAGANVTRAQVVAMVEDVWAAKERAKRERT